MTVTNLVLGLVVIIPIVTICLIWVWYHWKYRRILLFARKLPTVKPTVPLLGHLHHALPDIDGVISNLALNMSLEAAARNCRGFCLWAGPVPFIVIQNPDDINVLLNSSKSLERGRDYRLLKFALGESLFTGAVSLWTLQRRHIQPMFLARSFEKMIPIMNEQSKRMTEELCKFVDEPGDVLETVMTNLLSSTAYFVFGPNSVLDLDSNSALIQGLYSAIQKIFETLALRIVRVWLQWDTLFEILYRVELDEIKALMKHAEPIYQEFHEKFNTGYYEQKIPSEGTNSQVFITDAFAKLHRTNPRLIPESNLKDLVNNLMGAGSDTTATVVSTCLLALAHHPHIQEQVFHEIYSTFGGTEVDISAADIKRLPFLDRVLKETMRRYTLAPLISRTVTADIKTSLGVIPKGTCLYIDIQGNHMNPHAFPDPEKFDPDRFLPENSTKRNKLSFMPFSAGPRNCIGKEYSYVLMKIVLVHIVRRYKIFTDVDLNDYKFKYRSTLIREGGYPLRLEKRLR